MNNYILFYNGKEIASYYTYFNCVVHAVKHYHKRKVRNGRYVVLNKLTNTYYYIDKTRLEKGI